MMPKCQETWKMMMREGLGEGEEMAQAKTEKELGTRPGVCAQSPLAALPAPCIAVWLR